MSKLIRKGVVYAGNIYDTQPVGEVIQMAGDKNPAGYLPCDGRSVLRSDYPELFKKIGTKYGAEDDEHFNLPTEDDVDTVSTNELNNALTSQYEDITSQCVAINNSVTINGVYAYKMGSIITLCADIISKGAIHGIIQIPQKYTPRSTDYSHFWYPYNIKGYSAYATINHAREFYVQFESNIPAGERYNVTITYQI